MSKKPPFVRKLEVKDFVITGVEFSADGEAWADHRTTFGGAEAGGIPLLLDLLQNGERVLCRCIGQPLYMNGTRGLSTTGPVYEIKIEVIEPRRNLIEATAKAALPEAPAGTEKPPAAE